MKCRLKKRYEYNSVMQKTLEKEDKREEDEER